MAAIFHDISKYYAANISENILTVGKIVYHEDRYIFARDDVQGPFNLIVDTEEDREEALKGLRSFLKQGRVEADVEVLVREKGDVFNTIRNSSRRASLVFIGMRAPTEEESDQSYATYYEGLMARTDGFPSTAIVLASEDIEFDWIFASPGGEFIA